MQKLALQCILAVAATLGLINLFVYNNREILEFLSETGRGGIRVYDWMDVFGYVAIAFFCAVFAAALYALFHAAIAREFGMLYPRKINPTKPIRELDSTTKMIFTMVNTYWWTMYLSVGAIFLCNLPWSALYDSAAVSIVSNLSAGILLFITCLNYKMLRTICNNASTSEKGRIIPEKVRKFKSYYRFGFNFDTYAFQKDSPFSTHEAVFINKDRIK